MNYGKIRKIKGLGFLERDWVERTVKEIHVDSMKEFDNHAPEWKAKVENGECSDEGVRMMQTLVDYYSQFSGKHSAFKREVIILVNDDFSYDVLVKSFR